MYNIHLCLTFVICLLLQLPIHGQDIYRSADTLEDISLDLLSTPNTPAFLVMSTSPTEISEPGSSPEFYLSIQNASDNFSSFPNNYGVTITPFWWTKKAAALNFDTEYKTEQSLADVMFVRHLKISAGVIKINNGDADIWRYGLGVSSVLFNGKVKSDLKNKYYKKLSKHNTQYYTDFETYKKKNANVKRVEQMRTDLLERMRLSSLQSEKDSIMLIYLTVDSVYSDLMNDLQKQFELENSFRHDSLSINTVFAKLEKRIGFKMDVGLGLASDVYENIIDSSDLHRAGIWTNMGWTHPWGDDSYVSVLLLGRYMYYHDILYFTDQEEITLKPFSAADIGVQLKLDLKQNISFLLEAIYRTGSSTRYESNYKLNSLMQYRYRKNQLVYISFGNDFSQEASNGPHKYLLNVGINIGFGEDISIYTQ